MSSYYSFCFCSFAKCFWLDRCFCLSDARAFWKWKLKELKANLHYVIIYFDLCRFWCFSCFLSCQVSYFRQYEWIICSYGHVGWRTGCFLNLLQFPLFAWFDRLYEDLSFPSFQVRDRKKCFPLGWATFDQRLYFRVLWAWRWVYHNLNWAYSAFPSASGQYWEHYSCRKPAFGRFSFWKIDCPETTSNSDFCSSKAILFIQSMVATGQLAYTTAWFPLFS